MLTMADYYRIESEVSRIYSGIETDLIMKIVRTLHSQTKTLAPDDWKLRKLQGMGVLKNQLTAIAAKDTKKASAELENVFRDAFEASDELDMAMLRKIEKFAKPGKITLDIALTATEAQNRRISAVIANARKSINLTNTNAIEAGIEAYATAVNQAYLGVMEGIETLDNAVMKACRRLGGAGLKLHYQDENGRSTQVISLDAGIRRNVVTSIAQSTSLATIERCGEAGTDLVQVSAHAGARPEHEVWQGGIYSLSGKSTKYRGLYAATGYGTITGLCGINCKHHFFPYYEGMTKTDYGIDLTARQNEELYNDLQKQRRLEAAERSWKRRLEVSKGINDPAGIMQAQSKVREYQAKLRELCREKDLPRRYARERV